MVIGITRRWSGTRRRLFKHPLSGQTWSTRSRLLALPAGQLMDLALWALDDVKPGVAGSYITSKLAKQAAPTL